MVPELPLWRRLGIEHPISKGLFGGVYQQLSTFPDNSYPGIVKALLLTQNSKLRGLNLSTLEFFH